MLVSVIFAASRGNTLDWRIVYYSELSITFESCFAVPLSFHSCLSSTNDLFWWSLVCGSSDCLCHVGSCVILLGCKTKSQHEVQCCLPEHCAGLAVGICLSSAGILPLGLGTPFFALSLSGVVGPLLSGNVCCPGLRWAAGTSLVPGCMAAGSCVIHPAGAYQLEQFSRHWDLISQIFIVSGKEVALMLLDHCLVCWAPLRSYFAMYCCK